LSSQAQQPTLSFQAQQPTLSSQAQQPTLSSQAQQPTLSSRDVKVVTVDSKDAKNYVGQTKICCICLDPIGWTYPSKPCVGTMCIECSINYAKTKDAKADIKDPATTLVLPKCPWCDILLNAFIITFHYSKCSGAPEEVKKLNTSPYEEHQYNNKSRDRWLHYMQTKSSTSGVFGVEWP
jgi:hypothetical protein